jgi:hypothetical protein
MTGKMSPAATPTGSSLASRADLTFFADAFDSEDEPVTALADFEILLTMRERTAFPETLLRCLPKLRMIGITGAHVATLDLKACSRLGIVVCNTAGGGPGAPFAYDEFKARQQQQKAESLLSFEEVTRRVLAQQAASVAQSPTKPTLPPERAARMLTLASPNIWGEIIPKLSGEDALEVAERITDVELRDALVRYSLGVS